MSLPRVSAIGYIRLKNPDGSLMSNDKGEPVYARAHSPASKIWENANAVRKRRTLKMVSDNGGKVEAVADEPIENVINFLTTITEEFINLDMELPKGEAGNKALVEAVYKDPELGYIRDQMEHDAKDWGAYMGKLPTD